MRMKIQALPMSYGDCFVVEFIGNTGKSHVLVLDMGTSQVYMSMGRRLLKRYDEIDICILSHVHDDHIGGALKYIDDVEGGLKVPYMRQWWFNGVGENEISPKSSGTIQVSVKQGNKIAQFLSNIKESWQNTIKRGDVYKLDGLTIHVLAPETVDLSYSMPCPEEDISTIPVAATGNDYGIKVDEFETNSFDEDTNEINRQSIALLLEWRDKRFLWMADALPSVVAQSLRDMGYDAENKLECEYMTLSHHGSKKNTSVELLSLIDCKKFIITANGQNMYCLPHKETMAKVIMQEGDDVNFYTPLLSLQLSHIFEVDGKYNITEKTEFEV